MFEEFVERIYLIGRIFSMALTSNMLNATINLIPQQ